MALVDAALFCQDFVTRNVLKEAHNKRVFDRGTFVISLHNDSLPMTSHTMLHLIKTAISMAEA